MSITSITILAALACINAYAAESASDDKAAIAALEQRIATAVHAKDANAILANYVKGEKLLVFDAIPPRQYQGWEAYRKDWQGVLDLCADSPKMDIGDLSVEVEGSLAYSHSIQHFACTGAKGNAVGLTMRTTDIYRKTAGEWLVVHEHNSVPADLATAQADLSSKP
jgi:ketosteroid isomerase-like protein